MIYANYKSIPVPEENGKQNLIRTIAVMAKN